MTRTRKLKKCGGGWGSHKYVDLTSVEVGDRLKFNFLDKEFQNQFKTILDHVLNKLKECVNDTKYKAENKLRSFEKEQINMLKDLLSIFSSFDRFGELEVMEIAHDRLYTKIITNCKEYKIENAIKIFKKDDNENDKPYIYFTTYLPNLKLYHSCVRVIKKAEINRLEGPSENDPVVSENYEGGKKNTTRRKNKRKHTRKRR